MFHNVTNIFIDVGKIHGVAYLRSYYLTERNLIEVFEVCLKHSDAENLCIFTYNISLLEMTVY